MKKEAPKKGYKKPSDKRIKIEVRFPFYAIE